MRLLTGDECGILKECLPSVVKKCDEVIKNEGSWILNPREQPSRRRGIVDLCWTTSQRCVQAASAGFAALRMDGTVQVWKRRDRIENESFGGYRAISEIADVFNDGSREADAVLTPFTRPLGLARLVRSDDDEAPALCLLAACNAQGTVSILNINQDSKPSVVRHFPTFGASPTTNDAQYPLACCMGVNETKQWIAVGGKDRETSIYDLESASRIWKTKNLPANPQTLLQPTTWPSAIHFLTDHHRMVVGNDLQVRLYDVRTASIQRRPVAYTPPGLLEQRVTCFCQTGEHDLVVADTAGYVVSVDLRNLKATGHARYVGPTGSVRQLAAHSKIPRMAAVGLDRMLRLYDTKTRRQVACMYLKQRLNCVLLGEEEGNVTYGDVIEGEEGTDIDRSGLNQEDDVRDYADSDNDDLSNGVSTEEAESSHDDESPADGGTETSSSDEEEEDGSIESAEEKTYSRRRNKRRRK